jgi:hypothetical protein
MILKMLPSLLSGCVMQVPVHWLMFHITFTHCQELMIHVRRSMNICATTHLSYSMVFVSGLVFLWLDYLSCTLSEYWLLLCFEIWRSIYNNLTIESSLKSVRVFFWNWKYGEFLSTYEGTYIYHLFQDLSWHSYGCLYALSSICPLTDFDILLLLKY